MKKAISLLSIFGVAMIAVFVPEASFAAEDGGGELAFFMCTGNFCYV